MDLTYISSTPRERGLLGVEKATLLYAVLTTVLIVVFRSQLHEPALLLTGRAMVVAGLGITLAVYHIVPSRLTLLLRYVYPLSLLGYWYPDTYEFCQLFPNLDHVFAAADLALFGGQPSISFSCLLPGKGWSELFHMAYFAYFPMIVVTVLSPLFTNPQRFGRTAFVVMASFFLYYVIYLFLPVTGPQYYFHAIGTDAALQGHFVHLGDYFRSHTEMSALPGPDGFFRQLVAQAHESGERPTAAFPSSHVGISTILMLLLRRDNRRLMWILFPFYVLLCLSTVYIRAHYLIDVFGGLLTALVFYLLTSRLYPYAERSVGGFFCPVRAEGKQHV
jgi:membrane-associated phospholipid phosphatase